MLLFLCKLKSENSVSFQFCSVSSHQIKVQFCFISQKMNMILSHLIKKKSDSVSSHQKKISSHSDSDLKQNQTKTENSDSCDQSTYFLILHHKLASESIHVDKLSSFKETSQHFLSSMKQML